jgi:hypothetical protein
MTRARFPGRVASQMRMNTQVKQLTRTDVANFVLAIWFAARELRAAVKAWRRGAAFQ